MTYQRARTVHEKGSLVRPGHGISEQNRATAHPGIAERSYEFRPRKAHVS